MKAAPEAAAPLEAAPEAADEALADVAAADVAAADEAALLLLVVELLPDEQAASARPATAIPAMSFTLRAPRTWFLLLITARRPVGRRSTADADRRRREHSLRAAQMGDWMSAGVERSGLGSNGRYPRVRSRVENRQRYVTELW